MPFGQKRSDHVSNASGQITCQRYGPPPSRNQGSLCFTRGNHRARNPAGRRDPCRNV